MLFPKNATNEERIADWRLIAEIKDADFGFNTPKEKTNITRFGVRVLLFNERQEICVIKSEKYDYMQLPGGGIEKDESILDGLKRETREETGFLIKDIKPLGITIEKRGDIRNTHEFDQDISYIFSASPDKEVGTNYMDDEIAEGFKPIWISLDDFISEQEAREGKIENYSGCFATRRDLEIVRYYNNFLSNP